MTPGFPSYAGAVVQAPDSRLLCQLRDCRPGIVAPGRWVCSPGGGVRAGEAPQQAMRRELREEFSIDVAGVRFLDRQYVADGDYRGVYFCYATMLATALTEIECHEGAGIGFFPMDQALFLLQHPVSRIFLKAFMRHGAR